MKRNLFLLIGFLALAISAFAENVTIQTAQRAAQSFLNSKMEDNPQIHLIDFAEKSSFPNFYVFGNEHCFVIIAGDDCVQPILGYSTESGINTGPMPEAVYEWLEACDKGIAATKENHLEAPCEIQSQWESLLNGRTLEQKSRSRVEPLVRTRWQYSTPFNNLCPADTAAHDTGGHAKAGCGAVALSQLMNFWEHPVRGVGSFSYTPNSHPEYGTQYVNFGETVYDWDNMRNVYQKTYLDVEALAVATLVYHCGVSVQMNYGPDASGTSTPRLKQALTTYFDYSADMELKDKDTISDDRWILLLKNDLDNERPIIYRGQSESSNGGHIFICDGYDENDYFHFNWGYLGRWDGFYAMGSLFGGVDYSYVNRAIFGIFPNPTSINPPANVATSVSGRNVSVTWGSVNNAATYKLYRDGDLIANNITHAFFTDNNAPYGEHCYYVKSVKSDGTMSLKSNTSIADVHFSGPVPANIQSTVSGHVVNLLWDTPQPESSILQYGAGSVVSGFGKSSNGIHWAQRFSATTLSDYAGMAIQRVSFYVRRSGASGAYLISIYKGDEANPKELVYQQNYQTSSTVGWQDVNFLNPIPIDCTKDLWVVFYADSSISYPAAFCKYSGSGVVDAALYSSVSGGTIWKEYVYTDSNNVSYTCSWLMKTFITDGSYTYNLYRNGHAIATNLSDNTYTDTNLPDGIYNYHVTTNYFGGKSDPSNTASALVGNPTYTINASANPNNGGTVTGSGTYNYNQSCTMTATANMGYVFVNWTENGEIFSTDSEYSFTVVNNRNLVANFIRVTDIRFITAGNWSNASNWQGGALPCASDGVFIDAPCSLDMDAEVADLTVGDGAILSLQSSRILTVTGNLSSPEVACLVIKDGAQIINTTVDVNATMEKDIVAFEDERGWYTIASPMTGMDAEGSAFLTPEYDLYRYNESNLTDEEWENYKSGVEDFSTFENGRGYLYANSNTFTPAFTGTLNVASVSKELTYTERSDELSGFHLIGNPFPHVIYKGLGVAIDNADMASGYYVLNDSGSWEAKTFEDAILPGQGILVKTTASTDLIINNSTAMANSESTTRKGSHKRLAITVTCNEGKDCVYAYFGQGNDLAKVKGMAQNNPRFAIRTTNGDFAIAHFAKESDEMDLVFASFNNGPVTLGVNAVAVDFEYLHLVDLSTGDDIDLLRQPSYTFDALGQNHKTCFKIFYRLSSVEMNQ